MSKKNIAIILFASLTVATIASFFASSRPDGLEWVAGRLGFLGWFSLWRFGLHVTLTSSETTSLALA